MSFQCLQIYSVHQCVGSSLELVSGAVGNLSVLNGCGMYM